MRKLIFSSIVIALLFPSVSSAATFEVAGWIPYWTPTAGPRDVRSHLDQLTEIHPFAFTVQPDGSLKDLAGLSKSAWKRLFKSAKSEGVRITPTVMSSDGAATQRILSDASLREEHIDEIVEMVKKGKYDGVDIDYEAKLAITKDYFSIFLRELKAELGSKMLSCTIEARTPPDSLYKTIPANIQYANDFVAINQYCDRVTLMAYDQRRADLKLNAAKIGSPYMPVSDVDWVRKTVALALQTISKDKLMLGIPTYGHEYQVTVAPDWFRDYARVSALNPEDALDLADDFNVDPTRSKAGELNFSYLPKHSPIKLSSSLPIPKDTPRGNLIAARALSYANQTGQTVTFNYVTWSDAEAIEQKINLAKEFGLRGVKIFKFDGEEDEDIWDIL